MTSQFWPLFDLQLVTKRLVLRPPRDEDFAGLIEATDAGIHGPEEMPFSVPWTDVEPSARRIMSAKHWWALRANWTSEDWHLGLAVFLEGRPVGVQSILGKHFPTLKEVSTGSWLTKSAQGRGIGREMRAAALRLAFDGLGAEIARSAAFVDNPASLAVSRAIGYRENGRLREAPRGVPKEIIGFELTREEWREVSKGFEPAQILGLEGCVHMFTDTSDPPK